MGSGLLSELAERAESRLFGTCAPTDPRSRLPVPRCPTKNGVRLPGFLRGRQAPSAELHLPEPNAGRSGKLRRASARNSTSWLLRLAFDSPATLSADTTADPLATT